MLNGSPGLEWSSEAEIMMLTPGWEHSGTVQKDCEGSSWGHGFVWLWHKACLGGNEGGRAGLPPWEFHAKLGQGQARLLVGQVFSKDCLCQGHENPARPSPG